MTGPSDPVGQTLSALVITMNEERNIADCLSTLAFAGEVVVVDSGSTDRTCDIAREMGAKMYTNPWPGYGRQKNFGMEKASGDWVLIVDADERVTPGMREEVLRLLGAPEDPPFAAYTVPRKNYEYGRWIAHGGAYPDRQLRLLRRGKGAYNDVEVHENLIVDGSIGRLESPLLHFSERSTSERVVKVDRYAALSAKERAKRGIPRVGWSYLLLHPAATFWKIYIMKRGFLDGMPGYIHAVMASFQTFLKYSKLCERGLCGFADDPPAPGHGRSGGK
jgi:glycosyltransferase involved in cell wall biosynthesis